MGGARDTSRFAALSGGVGGGGGATVLLRGRAAMRQWWFTWQIQAHARPCVGFALM